MYNFTEMTHARFCAPDSTSVIFLRHFFNAYVALEGLLSERYSCICNILNTKK